MISRCGLMTKKEGMSTEEFQEYWLNTHGPIAAKMTNLRQYDQHLVTDNEHRHPLGQGPIVIDGYSELQFDSYGDMLQGVASLNGEDIDDVAKFADPNVPMLVLAKREVIRIPEHLRGKELIQRVSFLGRADGVSSERFQYEWWNVHDHMVQTAPGCCGYNQNLVIDRIVNGESVPYEQLPVEGVVEMWFENQDAFDEFYASPEFKRTAEHGSTFIGKINTYLTKTFPVNIPE